MTHDELATDLAAHLRGASKRVTWEDMQLGPSGTVRPDVYTMEPTFTRLSFEAFECKVSVSDFRADVTRGKWQAYLRYANSVTFATPLGLVGKTDVPATCGLICRGPAGQWRYLKRPTHQVLTELPWQAWVKLLLDGVQRSGFDRRQTMFSEWRARQVLAKKYGEEVAKQLSDLQGLPARLQYAEDQHQAALKRMREQEDQNRTRMQVQRDEERERCSGALARLAVAMGLPGDCTPRDLDGRAEALLGLLQSGRHRWRENDLVNLAGEMERTAQRLREAGQLLSGAPAGAEEGCAA